MTTPSLPIRSLTARWRLHIAVALGVVAATATLTGALIVGDAVRASLRAVALRGLGATDLALVGPRFIHASAAENMGDAGGEIIPLIVVRGSATQASRGARASDLTVLGVDDRFRALFPHDATAWPADLSRLDVALNRAAADQMKVHVGEDILLRVGSATEIPTETLLGRRDEQTVGARLTVRAIVPNTGAGGFSLAPRPTQPATAFLSLSAAQRMLEQPGRVNALLVHDADTERGDSDASADSLNARLKRALSLDDFGLRVRMDEQFGYFALESKSLLIPPNIETMAMQAGEENKLSASRVIAYFANAIRIAGAASADAPREVPYSTVVAIDADANLIAQLPPATPNGPPPALAPGQVLLNDWTARQLNAKVGDQIELAYYVTSDLGQLDTKTATFELAGVVATRGLAVDAGFVPEYPGVTAADTIADWDPPFPIDLTRVRDIDEAYWDDFRTAPKAFATLADGERLWSEGAERFGRYTSIRFRPPQGETADDAARRYTSTLLQTIEPESLGIAFQPVRQRALAAATGSTDFGGLFIGFSLFLIAAAAMLTTLLFRLGVERRAPEIGLMRAVGLPNAWIRRQLVWEGLVIAVIGAAVGLLAAVAYAGLMLLGLRTWWAAAANAPFLTLAVEPRTLVVGFVGSVLLALMAMLLALRGLLRQGPRALLAGDVEQFRPPRTVDVAARRAPLIFAGALALLAFAIGLFGWTAAAMARAGGFFGSGALLLIAALLMIRERLRPRARATAGEMQTVSLARFGARGATRRRGRSMLTCGLVASATFIVAALGVFRMDPAAALDERDGGSGGFDFVGQTATPMLADLRQLSGDTEIELDEDITEVLARSDVFAFRLRDGDAASCTNLYLPQQPRILGAPDDFIERGGFAFSTSRPRGPGQKSPWSLLYKRFDDGAIPVIGDEAAVLWQLHKGLGQDLVVADEQGRPVTLRFVALLSNSMLQDELIMADDAFRQVFPSAGYQFFLFDAPDKEAATLATNLERQLTDFGFDATTAESRLRAYLAVQNTFITTFQMLGGFGLILGTLGVTAIMIRAVFERRRELALMHAVGLRRGQIAAILTSEAALLIGLGLLAGTIPALLAILPTLIDRADQLPWLTLFGTLAGVMSIGVGVTAYSLRLALRGSLITALRSE